MSWAKICSSVIPAASSPYKSKRKSFKSGTASLVGATSKVSYENIGEDPTSKNVNLNLPCYHSQVVLRELLLPKV